MDAIVFLKTWRRICKSYEMCEGCPLSDDGICMNNYDSEKSENEVVSIVEKWLAEHPEKTRQSELLRIYPNAIMDVNGIVNIDPCALDSFLQDVCNGISCSDCREKYWNEEIWDESLD